MASQTAVKNVPVEELDRDLSFHPVRNDTPRMLTPPQIKDYNERGVIYPLDVFDDQAVLENRAFFDGILKEMEEAGHNSYSINGFHRSMAGVWDLANNPTIISYVRDLLGENFVFWGTHYFCKLPHDGKAVPWHQDGSYWPLTPTKTVTAWLAIDDADRENSAMMVIPGTHTKGHLKWEQTKQDAVLNQEVVNAEDYGDPEWVEMKAGQISLHSDMLVHGSEPNESDRRRCGLTIRYAAMDVTAHNGWNRNSTWAMGQDPRKGSPLQWANNPRPENNDVKAALQRRYG